VLNIFKIASLELFAQGWLQTLILLISAFWVARITGMSHQHPAQRLRLNKSPRWSVFEKSY
jgi:hypothetical protein